MLLSVIDGYDPEPGNEFLLDSNNINAYDGSDHDGKLVFGGFGGNNDLNVVPRHHVGSDRAGCHARSCSTNGG